MFRFLQSSGWKVPFVIALVLTVLSQLVENRLQNKARALPSAQSTALACALPTPHSR